MFLEILQNSQENTCSRVSFLIKAWCLLLKIYYCLIHYCIKFEAIKNKHSNNSIYLFVKLNNAISEIFITWFIIKSWNCWIWNSSYCFINIFQGESFHFGLWRRWSPWRMRWKWVVATIFWFFFSISVLPQDRNDK